MNHQTRWWDQEISASLLAFHTSPMMDCRRRRWVLAHRWLNSGSAAGPLAQNSANDGPGDPWMMDRQHWRGSSGESGGNSGQTIPEPHDTWIRSRRGKIPLLESTLLCKAKRRWLLTWKVSSYRILALHGSSGAKKARMVAQRRERLTSLGQMRREDSGFWGT